MKCFEILGLTKAATLAEVKSSFRALAAKHHPDRGGDASYFDQVSKSYQEALEYLQRDRKCVPCNGTGKILHTQGFQSIKIRCKYCNGRGNLKGDKQ